MNNNIFFQNIKNKYNPDISNKLDNIEKDRQTTIFKKSNNVYNSITNEIPNVINSGHDLELLKDKPITNLDKLVSDKLKERTEIENTKTKVIHTNVPNQEIPTYNELKNNYKNINQNINKNSNILNDLKNLGIIN
jgi:hypothetical protein